MPSLNDLAVDGALNTTNQPTNHTKRATLWFLYMTLYKIGRQRRFCVVASSPSRSLHLFVDATVLSLNTHLGLKVWTSTVLRHIYLKFRILTSYFESLIISESFTTFNSWDFHYSSIRFLRIPILFGYVKGLFTFIYWLKVTTWLLW